LKILYSPLHGVGTTAVCPVLEADGFAAVEVFGPHADPDPDFSHVPDRMANPENRAVFTAIIEHARRIGAELILATDPDADRIGCAAPFSLVPDAPWETITGNQAGALLTDFLLGVRRAAGTLTPQHYVVKTLVTTELIRRIAEDYGVQTVGNLLVGFRWIAAEIDRRGPELFLLGAEESYGLLAGAHVRDKDGAVAAMLLAELAARLKQQGRTLHDKLDELFLRHGCHSEGQLNLKMPGEEGMADMRRLMTRLREDPPRVLGGLKIAAVHDYWRREVRRWDGSSQPIEGVPQADMLFFELESVGNRVAVRPSGTEPKVKFYTFAYDPPQHNLAAVKAKQQALLQQLEADLRAIAAETLSAR
jgi:phosphoglucomutase/phosphomannomutase